MSDEFYRGDGGEVIELRYLDIPGRELAENGLREIDEVVCGPMHLETTDESSAYLNVAGLHINVWATRVKGERRPRLSITCEPSPDARIENGGGS